jgi:hypothetical protein
MQINLVGQLLSDDACQVPDQAKQSTELQNAGSFAERNQTTKTAETGV